MAEKGAGLAAPFGRGIAHIQGCGTILYFNRRCLVPREWTVASKGVAGYKAKGDRPRRIFDHSDMRRAIPERKAMTDQNDLETLVMQNPLAFVNYAANMAKMNNMIDTAAEFARIAKRDPEGFSKAMDAATDKSVSAVLSEYRKSQPGAITIDVLKNDLPNGLLEVLNSADTDIVAHAGSPNQ